MNLHEEVKSKSVDMWKFRTEINSSRSVANFSFYTCIETRLKRELFVCYIEWI
jgi:hypothetical protein